MLHESPRPRHDHAAQTALLGKKPNLIKRFLSVSLSSISVFTEKSYKMKMGEVRGLRETVYFLVQPDLVRKLLTSPASEHPKGDFLSQLLEKPVGKGTFVATGPDWERRRAVVNEAFQAANVAKVFPHMMDAAQAMVTRLDTQTGRTIALDEETTFVAADIIFRTLFSQSLNKDEARTLFKAFEIFQAAAFAHGAWCMAGLPSRWSPRKIRAEKPGRVLRGALEHRVDERLALRALGQTGPGDLLYALIDARDPNGQPLTRDELVDEVGVMFLAGHETSASALAWAFYLISKDTSVQDRLHQEVDGALGSEALTPRDFKSLPLVRDVFRETLRLYPPIAFVPRRTVKQEQWRDKTLKPGATIFASLWLLHRHSEHWTNADSFDPDRFSREDEKSAVRRCFMPFSMGPRVCIGASFAMQEAAIVMATLLQRYTFHPDETHRPHPIAKLTLRSKNGIRLRLEQR